MKIGVFDSGVGGRSFVAALQERFPDAEIIYKEDRENLPYGDKTPDQLLALTLPIFRQFEQEGCEAVLVACNTVTTNIITQLREQLDIPLVGVEPMIKPAAKMTRSGVIAVCATPATLRSQRYADLKRDYASGVRVIEPDCSNWALMIENNRENELALEQLVKSLKSGGADVLVLGCTHYHWIEEDLRKFASPEIEVIQPINPVLDQLERILERAVTTFIN